MLVQQWLSLPWDDRAILQEGLIPGVQVPTKLQVLTALVVMNGGEMTVRAWGVQQSGGLYGRSGLSQDEALCLLQLGSIVHGMLMATDGAEKTWLSESIKSEMQRVGALRRGQEEGHGEGTEGKGEARAGSGEGGSEARREAEGD